MANPAAYRRNDRVSRIIEASPHAIYRAMINPDDLMSWLPPKGMSGEVRAFEPRAGGAYEVALFYEHNGQAAPGKTSADSDIVNGRFIEVVANERIVQEFAFDSPDPAFAGVMTMTWQFTPVPQGTEVTITCENVPDGILQEDHIAGMTSTLDNLAAFIERKAIEL